MTNKERFFISDTMKNDYLRTEKNNNYFDRDELLSANSKLIDQLQKRINVKRFKVQEGDNLRLGYVRALIAALTVQNSILKDLELCDIQRRLEALESKGDNEYTSVEELE